MLKASAANLLFTTTISWLASLFDGPSTDNRTDDGIWTSAARGM